jgi:hypothetical protein
MHFVDYLYEDYHDARSSEHKVLRHQLACTSQWSPLCSVINQPRQFTFPYENLSSKCKFGQSRTIISDILNALWSGGMRITLDKRPRRRVTLHIHPLSVKFWDWFNISTYVNIAQFQLPRASTWTFYDSPEIFTLGHSTSARRQDAAEIPVSLASGDFCC